MAGLKDVARVAGVDPSTASRVLRGDPAQHVRPETRQRILDAATSLRYRPNALARSLRTRRSDTIGLVIPSLDNVGFADVTHGIQQAAAQAGKLVLVVEAAALPAEDQRSSEAVYERLVSDGQVDGLIVAFATLDDHHVARLSEHGTPLVLVNRRTSGVHGSVVVDDERGSRMAVDHLVGLGHRHIGYVGLDADTDTAQRRRRGFLDGLERAGLTAQDDLIEAAPPTVEGGRAGIVRLLEGCDRGQMPTAVFVASLMAALGVNSGLRASGLRIPQDASLIAFNDHPVAEHLAPALTTVRMPSLAMGRESVRLLLAAIDGQPVEDVMIEDDPEIIVRASTATAAEATRPAGVSR